MLKAALIGTGFIAREHLAALSRLPNVEIGGVCDLSAALAEATAERFGVRKWYTDYSKMLADIRPDLVHITTPPTSHFTIARESLAAGVNVLCEKPITVEYKEFVELKGLATRAGLMLMENQNCRFNSSILRILELVASGELGEIVDVHVAVFLNINANGSRYVDPNAPHPCLGMPGGAIADFLTHIGYLACMFAGPPLDVRTVWSKRVTDSLLPVDEFRALINGERATAYVGFSANAQPNGFWVRVVGTKMQAETNLFEAPRLTFRRLRPGVQALMTFVDGVAESRGVLGGAIGGLWRKVKGTSSYDGLAELISRTYQALEAKKAQPISIEEIDAVARLVAAFTNVEQML